MNINKYVIFILVVKKYNILIFIYLLFIVYIKVFEMYSFYSLMNDL